MGWDKGLDWDEFIQEVKKEIEDIYPPEGERERRLLCYWCVLAVQARNGLRVSEAIDALKEFIKTGKARVDVRVRKKKRNIMRPAIIPDFVQECKDELDYVFHEKFQRRLIAWASKHKRNTHSVRYSWITKKLKEGHNPAIVSKAVRHSRIDIILAYTQKIEADKLVEED